MFSTPRVVLNVKSQHQQNTLTPSQHRDAFNGLQYLNALSASQPPPNIQHPPTIQIPMLSALQVPQPQLNSQPNGPPQQQQQQQQQQNALGQQGQGIPPPPPQNGQDYTLSSVLHFLQTEWRCYERDRNEWEIARAEMRARIALLEGERRSFENVKLDLMRRIKMLEYALRIERAKQLGQPSTTAQSSKPNATQQAKEDAKEGSRGSSPRSEDSPLPPERAPNATSAAPPRLPSWSGIPPATTLQTTGTASSTLAARAPPGRDPKSRARSRDYLKQCLQEISYLTSPQAMNPLPNRPLITNPNPPMGPTPSVMNPGSAGGMGMGAGVNSNAPGMSATVGVTAAQNPGLVQPGQSQVSQSYESIYNGRPRKQLPDATGQSQGSSSLSNMSGKEFPLMGGTPATNTVNLPSVPASTPPSTGSLERGSTLAPAGSALYQQPQQQQQAQQVSQTQDSRSEQSQSSPQSQRAQPLPPLLHDSAQTLESRAEEQPSKPQTAFFRPGSTDAGAWREKLRASYEQHMERWRDTEEDETEEVGEEEDESEGVGVVVDEGEGEGSKLWKSKRTLRSHLDAVRAMAFHPTELCLATGGDDNTVKIWRMDVSALTSSTSRPTTESEPQLTLRGHSAAITRIVYSPVRQLIYSASLDASIRVWSLPSSSHTTYAPYDSTFARGELVGHTDAVWDLALVRDESTLISGGAEGAIKIWDVGVPGGGALRLSWGYHGLERDGEEAKENTEDPGATSVEPLRTDLKKVAVSYQNTVVKIFEIETGKEVSRLPTDTTYDGTPATQINRIVSHPTMPLLVTAHEDKFIRIFDILTAQCTHSIPAHLDGVTSLSIDAAGFSLVSGSHDCSVRFWDLLGSRTCTQEIPSHREKAKEGVLDVEFHPSLPVMASAGADGVVKLYASSAS